MFLGHFGVALGFGYRIVRGGGWRAFAVLAALVVSHWFLDVLVHRPDMPLTPAATTKVGLGIWNSVPATLVLELVVFGACATLYARSTRAVDRVGRWAFRALVAFFLVIYAGSVFGPPPPSAQAVAWSGVGMWLIIAWGGWVDAHRVAA